LHKLDTITSFNLEVDSNIDGDGYLTFGSQSGSCHDESSRSLLLVRIQRFFLFVPIFYGSRPVLHADQCGISRRSLKKQHHDANFSMMYHRLVGQLMAARRK
jgi:hypothetical protein